MSIYDLVNPSYGPGAPSVPRAPVDDGRIYRTDFIQAGRDNATRREESLRRLEELLTSAAEGRDSAAAQQVRMAGDRALNQQQALAASARPGQGGLAQRMAAQNSSRLNTQIMQQAALARLQEMAQAQGLLGQILTQNRGMDINQGFQQRNPSGEEKFFQTALGTAGMVLPYLSMSGNGSGGNGGFSQA